MGSNWARYSMDLRMPKLPLERRAVVCIIVRSLWYASSLLSLMMMRQQGEALSFPYMPLLRYHRNRKNCHELIPGSTDRDSPRKIRTHGALDVLYTRFDRLAPLCVGVGLRVKSMS